MSRRKARDRGEQDRDHDHATDQIAYAAPTPHPALQMPIMRALTCIAILTLVFAIFAGQARADGDPASDVLAVQSLFLPWDANVPSAQQAQLQSVVRSAQHRGFPIRVAVIASETDLGSVSALWHSPQAYAELLGDELSLLFKGPLLVVMPNRFGLHDFTMPANTIRSTLSAIHAPTDSAQLAQVTITAIQRLASAAGHPLPGNSTHAAPVAAERGEGSIGALGWIVFLLGCVAIAAAWSMSLRIEPPHSRGGVSS